MKRTRRGGRLKFGGEGHEGTNEQERSPGGMVMEARLLSSGTFVQSISVLVGIYRIGS